MVDNLNLLELMRARSGWAERCMKLREALDFYNKAGPDLRFEFGLKAREAIREFDEDIKK